MGGVFFSGFLVTDKWLHYIGKYLRTRKIHRRKNREEWSKICDHVGMSV